MQTENIFHYLVHAAKKNMRPLIKSGYHIIPSNYFFHLSMAKNTELYLDNHHMTIPLL